jgi:hypothetical protein
MNSTTITALIALAFAALSVFSGYRWGHHDAELAAFKAQHAAVSRAIEQANTLNAQDAAILRASEKTRVITHTRMITRIQRAASHVAKNPNLYNLQLDACGVCLARSAAGNTDSTNCPCQSDGAMPSSIATGGRD